MAAGHFSRRQVLGTGVGAASAMFMGVSGVAAQEAAGEKTAKAQKDDIRCGMIGTGGRGSGVLKAIHKSPGVRVTALCDLDAERLNAAAKKVEEDKPALFTDYRKLIEHKELDAIFVETPCYLHAEMVLAVLASGRHCYGEKPMALTVKDLNAMLHASRQAKGIYQVGTQLRYASPWQPAIKFILSGEYGKPILVRAHRHNVGDMPHDRGWFFKRALSGDTICEQAVHEFDLFNWLFGGLPLRAAGYGGQAVRFEPKGRDILDHYALTLDYGPNREVAYSHSWISVPKVPCDGRQEIVYCEKGAVDIEGGKVFPKEGDPVEVSAEPKGDSTQLAVNDFFRCIREGDQPLANAESARNGVLTALMGRKAIYEGRMVTMQEILAEG